MPVDDENKEKDKLDEYIQQVKDLKENTVAKDEYEKILNERNKLADELLNNRGTKQEEKEKTSDELKEIFNKLGPADNLTFAKTALELRETLIREGKPDPFLPNGKDYSATTSDIEEANKVAEVMKDCIDDSDGSSTVFTAMFKERLVEPPQVTSKMLKKGN